MGSSAWISSGMCRFGRRSKFRRQVPEGSEKLVPEGSGRSGGRCVGVGSGGRVQKVPENSGVVCCLATLTGVTM